MSIDFTRRTRSQYVFKSRRCRQRIGQALGRGHTIKAVAARERVPVIEIDALLAEESFAGLVLHYRELASLAPDERRARLVELALDMLERLVATGDLRAVTFILHETARGRDPAGELADAATRKAEAATAGSAVRGARAAPATLPGSSQRAGDWACCAATQADETAAVERAASEARRVRARLTAARCRLRDLLLQEAERAGTAVAAAVPTAPDLPAIPRSELGTLARILHHRPAEAFRAARALQDLRDGFAAGRLGQVPNLAARPLREESG